MKHSRGIHLSFSPDSTSFWLIVARSNWCLWTRRVRNAEGRGYPYSLVVVMFAVFCVCCCRFQELVAEEMFEGIVAGRAPFLCQYVSLLISFDSCLSDILSRYLGKFVKGLDKENLKIAIFGGDVVLENLEIRVSALRELHLPVSVKAGERVYVCPLTCNLRCVLNCDLQDFWVNFVWRYLGPTWAKGY